MIKQNVISLGLVMALVSIVIFLIQTLAGGSFVISAVTGTVAFGFMIVLPIVYIRKQRKEFGGFIIFWDAFKVAFFGLLLGGVISSVFTVMYVSFIDQDYIDRSIMSALETQQRFMENAVPVEQMEETMRLTEQGMRDAFTPVGYVKTFGYYVVFYLVLSLIFAAFLKKEDPRQGADALDAIEP